MDYNRLFNLESEASVLGSILHDPEAILKVAQAMPDPEAFFQKEHRQIYECMLAMMVRHVTIDGVALQSELQDRGYSADGDWVSALKLGETYGSVASASNVMYYTGVVLDHAKYRALVQTIHEAQEALKSYDTTDDIASKIRSLVLEQETGTQQQYRELDADEAALDMIETDKHVIETGFRDLDVKVNFGPGDVVVIAGRPSMGKSALASNIVQNMAKNGHVAALIISLEMTPLAVAKRMICRESRVNARYVNECDMPKIADAAEVVGKLPIKVAEHTSTVTQIMALVAQLKASENLAVVVLDYIQLLGGANTSQNRNNELAAISRTLKVIALEYSILMIVVSQLNRGVEARNDKHPKMSDLRDSGAIEQDADWVLLLYRDDYYRNQGDEKDGLAEVAVAKARDGETGNVQLVFLPEITSFEDVYRGKESFL